MDYLRYKTFVWPRNPHTEEEKASRDPRYHTESGVTYYDGMGDLKRTITGECTFYGADAYDQYKQLQLLIEDKTAGNLEHPIWGIRYCYFTGLELTQEPKENVVNYKFTFTQALQYSSVFQTFWKTKISRCQLLLTCSELPWIFANFRVWGNASGTLRERAGNR